MELVVKLLSAVKICDAHKEWGLDRATNESYASVLKGASESFKRLTGSPTKRQSEHDHAWEKHKSKSKTGLQSFLEAKDVGNRQSDKRALATVAIPIEDD